jgi:hypothetical protein
MVANIHHIWLYSRGSFGQSRYGGGLIDLLYLLARKELRHVDQP